MITSVDVVLPCLDEAEALPGVLRRLPAGYRAIVVDNGSTDDTAAVAASAGAVVVEEPKRGYGAAVHAGLVAATGEVVCVLDADGSLAPEALPGLVASLAGGADLAVGRRVPDGAGAWPWHARAGNLLIAALLRRRGIPVRDIGPVRAGRRDALLALGVRDRTYGYPLELLLRAGAAGWRIDEADVAYRPRSGGRSKVSGSVRGTFRAVWAMTAVLAGTR